MKDMRRIDENECAKQNIVWQSQNDPFKVFPTRILNIIKLYYDNIYIYTYYISLYFLYILFLWILWQSQESTPSANLFGRPSGVGGGLRELGRASPEAREVTAISPLRLG